MFSSEKAPSLPDNQLSQAHYTIMSLVNKLGPEEGNNNRVNRLGCEIVTNNQLMMERAALSAQCVLIFSAQI